MKKVRYVSAAVLGFMALARIAQADPSDQITAPDDNPTIQYDRDGVPLAVTEKQPTRATPEEIAAYRKQQAKASADKDWLLRAYEKQSQAANPYNASANRDHGQPNLVDGDGADEKPLPRTGSNSAATLHPGSSPLSTAASQPFGGSFLKPMITPLSAPEAAGLNNFYSSLPVAGVSSYYGTDPQAAAPTLHARASVVPDETGEHDIDTPGMIAAEKNPLSDPNASNLTLDVLPGESVEHARAHQDNTDLLQLPQTLDADQFHRAQAAELSPPGPKKDAANQTATTAPAQPKPANDNDEPVPISKYPVINPVRAPHRQSVRYSQ